MEHNMVGWFEIPVRDMERAKQFYEAVFNISIQVTDFQGFLMGWFPFDESKEGISGSLVKHESYVPSNREGAVIYFSSKDVSNELALIEKAGGEILQPKTLISEEIGYMALFLDTEGNKIALHSQK
jgi:predicted enzyme related to lactoylglutathione lyase